MAVASPAPAPPAPASPQAAAGPDLVAGVQKGERRSLARLITLLESEDPRGHAALQALHGRLGKAHVIGITGSPGTGKSTLTDQLIAHYRRQGKSVGVVAVDPSSPFTGGAILGDRIRMQQRSTDPQVFIRSMGTRGALGGLSHHTADAVRALDAAGKDVVLVETVGVGQGEVDVVRLADTVVVVLVPNLGDDVQAVKAGIMEIADLFVVNKADLTGADKVAAEVEGALSLAHGRTEWTPPILRTIAERGEGVPAVADAVERHRQWSQASGEWQRRRDQRLREQVRSLLQRGAAERAFLRSGEVRPEWTGIFEDVRSGKLSPHQAAKRILDSR